MAVVVNPESFQKVNFDAAEIARIADAAGRSVCPDAVDELEVVVVIDENAPTSRCQVVALTPITFHVDRGALERYSMPEHLGDGETALTFARLFLEICDLRSDAFGSPPISRELSHAHRIAWDANLFGRAARMGYETNKPRHRYDFRNRHGFSRPVDRIFEQLWSGEELPWSEIVALSDTAAAPVVASRPRLMDRD